MKIHKLKLDHKYYASSETNMKTFEIRRNDRGFKVGDILELRDYDPKKGRYTGRLHWKMVTYILDDEEFLQPGYVCMSVVRIPGNALGVCESKDEVNEVEVKDKDD